MRRRKTLNLSRHALKDIRSGASSFETGAFAPMGKHPMTEVFSVDDMVTYTGAFSQTPIPCKIIKDMRRTTLIPCAAIVFGISAEAFERAVPEFALSLTTISATDAAFKR